MIEILIDLLRDAGINPGFLRVFDYITFRVMMAAVTAMVLEVVFGHAFIVFLYRERFRDTGGDFLSLKTSDKRGTPTGGGLLIMLVVGASLFLWGKLSNPYLLAASSAFFYFGVVGLFDDWQKVRLKSSLYGLSQFAKTFLQLAYIVPFAAWFVLMSPLPPSHRHTFFLPFVKDFALDLGPWVFGAFIVFAFFSIVNAVNISDGMDGLVTGPAVFVAALYGIFAYILSNAVLSKYLLFTFLPGAGELSVFAGALAGGLFGFLWFNAYPAEVFMGDTGSMSIGAALSALAFLTRQELLFPIAGGVFVASIFSSLVQEKIGMRLGRRVLVRAPLHHAHAYKGIAEPKVVVRYWIVSILLMLIAALSIKLR
ncbi:MAG: phospho-N-acetylmuramoyl-pentapeptide-transferase [Thermoanaerobaculia bacterium]|nr:phospho-N-acetylmuramoyl-pentapeptide-transferase [Thermoanaerobaculia bacterium]